MGYQTPAELESFRPQLGHSLHGDAIRLIVDAIEYRQKTYDEELSVSVGLILMNIGDRYQPLRCEGKEWRGLKKDIQPGPGEPTCPNGHSIIKERGYQLGWVIDRD